MKERFYISVVTSAAGFGAGLFYTECLKDSKILWGGKQRNLEENSNLISSSSTCHLKYKNAIIKSRELVGLFKDKIGTPGLVIGVSVNGESVWEEGTGFSDIEKRTPCQADTTMRIASISKPITMSLLAQMWERNEVDLDKAIQEYVPYFPQKKIDKETVTITTRQLANHTAGIRHYNKKGDDSTNDSGPEFYQKEKFASIEKSVGMFKDDNLCFKPGTSFKYTTHGYTLVSAVIEGAGKKPFAEQIKEFFKVLGLKHTFLDEVQTVIYNRSSYYTKNKQGQIINAELADTSYKWAGGGLLSTVGDLLRFGNAMLYSYQQDESCKPGILKKDTVRSLWTPVEGTEMKWGRDSGYGLGWTVVPTREEYGGLTGQRFYVGHGGGAVGASSVLLIFPSDPMADVNNNRTIPSGVVVAVLVNLEAVSCHNLAVDIAGLFQEENK